jgi:hypothetical protein
VALQRRKRNTSAITTSTTTGKKRRRTFEAPISIRVGRGRVPPSDAYRFSKVGTMKISMEATIPMTMMETTIG